MNPFVQLKMEQDILRDTETKRKLVDLLKGILISDSVKDFYKYDIDNLKKLILRTYIHVEEYKDYFMCITALNNSPVAFEYIPYEMYNLDLYIYIIRLYGKDCMKHLRLNRDGKLELVEEFKKVACYSWA